MANKKLKETDCKMHVVSGKNVTDQHVHIIVKVRCNNLRFVEKK